MDIIFTDKTGTLTANQMQFRSIYLGERQYGTLDQAEPTDQNKDKFSYVNFSDQEAVKVLSTPSSPNYTLFRESLLCVSLANELIVEPGNEYEGASTDELALAYFSKQLGIELRGLD